MKKWKDYYIKDLSRYDIKPSRYIRVFLKLYRKAHYSSNILLKNYYRLRYRIHCNKNGIEISSKVSIGEGLYIGHPYNINVNDKAILGNNINIHKGVTIGQENRGKRKGVPTIGNNVWIGINSCIVGKINIGDDVLIAPNTYVNCDIPSHCVVFGNPCIIKHKDNATELYVNNKVE